MDIIDSNDKYKILIQLLRDNGLIRKISKNNIDFKVIDNYKLPDFCPNGFFEDNVSNGNWENDTFNIIEYFSDKNGIFLDIGSWIGPFTLYASKLYKHVYSFEPDTVAFKMILQNILLNDFNNITLIPDALSNETGKSEFGGNGKLGNSESTLLVQDINNYSFQANNIGQRGTPEYRKQDIIEVNTLTIEDACKKYNINIFDIKLIKIDIEGGEFFLIPQMANFLKYIKPVLYISIHWCFLNEQDVDLVINTLFEIYCNCYACENKRNFKLINLEDIKNRRITDLLFLDYDFEN